MRTKKKTDTSRLVATTVVNKKISKVDNKIPNHDKYFTTPEFSKLTSENFAARLKQPNLVNKTEFYNKLIRFNRKFTLIKLNSLKTVDYNFFLGRIYFTSNDVSQNKLVYQPTLDKLVGNQTEYIILNLTHYILLSYKP